MHNEIYIQLFGTWVNWRESPFWFAAANSVWKRVWNVNSSKWVIKQFIKPLRYFASAMLNSLCLVGKKPFCLGSESELIWTEFKGTVSMPWRWIGSKGIGWTQNCLGLDPALGVTIFVLWMVAVSQSRSATMCQMPHIFIGWNAHEWMVVRVEEFTPVFVQVH